MITGGMFFGIRSIFPVFSGRAHGVDFVEFEIYPIPHWTKTCKLFCHSFANQMQPLTVYGEGKFNLHQLHLTSFTHIITQGVFFAIFGGFMDTKAFLDRRLSICFRILLLVFFLFFRSCRGVRANKKASY